MAARDSISGQQFIDHQYGPSYPAGNEAWAEAPEHLAARVQRLSVRQSAVDRVAGGAGSTEAHKSYLSSRVAVARRAPGTEHTAPNEGRTRRTQRYRNLQRVRGTAWPIDP